MWPTLARLWRQVKIYTAFTTRGLAAGRIAQSARRFPTNPVPIMAEENPQAADVAHLLGGFMGVLVQSVVVARIRVPQRILTPVFKVSDRTPRAYARPMLLCPARFAAGNNRRHHLQIPARIFLRGAEAIRSSSRSF